MNVDAGGAEARDDGEDVVRGPARHERAQNQRDRLERLLGAVLRLEFLLLLLPEANPLADLVDEVLALGGRGGAVLHTGWVPLHLVPRLGAVAGARLLLLPADVDVLGVAAPRPALRPALRPAHQGAVLEVCGRLHRARGLEPPLRGLEVVQNIHHRHLLI